MAWRGGKFGVVYVDGDVPQLPIQIGQLLVDTSGIEPGVTNLQQCTSQDPLLYEGVQGIFLRSPGEIAAGVLPVNYRYLSGYADRYGTNAVPGTTDMAPAFNAMYQVCKEGGCSARWGATAPYRLASSIDCTAMRGVASWDESSCEASFGNTALIIDHDGHPYSHGFDLSWSTEMSFYNVTATNAAGRVPNTLFFGARNPAGSGAGLHRFYNIRTPGNCKFLDVFYWYASEENLLAASNVWNSQNGGSLLSMNATNPRGYTSLYRSIATGDQSNALGTVRDTDLFNDGTSGTEVLVHLERASNFTWDTGLAYCPNGRSYVDITGTTGCAFLTLRTIRGETNAAAVCHGVTVRTSAATGADEHILWTLDDVRLYSSGGAYLLNCNSTSDISRLYMTGCYSNTGNLVNAHGLSNSEVSQATQVVTGQVGGTVTSTTFIGNRATVTLSGTATFNTYVDQATGRLGADGGVSLPRLTTVQRDAISSPPAGLLIYNSTTNKLNVRAAAAWEAVTSA